MLAERVLAKPPGADAGPLARWPPRLVDGWLLAACLLAVGAVWVPLWALVRCDAPLVRCAAIALDGTEVLGATVCEDCGDPTC